MPRIELRDPFGVSYRCDTRSDALLQAWLDEWLPRLYPADADPKMGNPAVMVYPLQDGPTYEDLDWPFHNRYTEFFQIPRDPAAALPALAAKRAEIAAKIAQIRDDRG